MTAPTMIVQLNRDERGCTLTSAMFCEVHGFAEAVKYHADCDRLDLVAAWEPQMVGPEVACFDLIGANLPGEIRFKRFEPYGDEGPCVVCEAGRF